MESLNSEDAADRMILSNKLRSPNQMSETNTMDSFQDGGQQNMNAEASDFPPQMEGSHMNSDMNSFPPSSGDHSMGPDNFNRMGDGMHPSQMQNYNAFNRGNYNMGDQHGGMSMAGSMEFGGHSSQYHGQYSHSGMRPAYPGMSKPGMTPSRPGMVPPGMGMMASTSPVPGQRMMSGQSLSQAAGPTPTLNQLLQTPNSSSQRYQNSYGEFGPGGSKGGEMGGGGGSAPMPYNPMQANWPGNQRMGGYPQGHMPGAASFRNQSGSFSEMGQQRRPMPSGYSQSGQFGGQQQFHPGSQRYAPGMMPGQPRPGPAPSQMPHMNAQQMHPQFGQHGSSGQMGFNPGGSGSQQQQQMYMSQQPQPPGPSPPQPLPPTSQQTPQKQPPSSQAPPQQPSPAPAPSVPTSASETSQSQGSENNRTHGTKRPAEDDSSKSETAGEENSQESSGARRTPTPSGSHHPPTSTHHVSPSPASSTGSRSNTPASVSGPQAGSPMPPRPSSGQHDAASRMSHSPMTTQGYNQQMMPPPMGPNQMGAYGPGTPSSKMMGGMMGSQMGHYPQYPNSQYPSGNYPRQQTMPPSMGSSSGGMQGFGQQSMYNGPGQMGGNPLYGGPMGMNRSSAYPGYSQGGMPMNSQYPGFSNHMGGQPGQGGPMPGSMPGASSMNSMSQPGMNNMNMQGGTMPNMPGGPASMPGLVPGPGIPGPGGMPGPGSMSGGPGGAMPGSGMPGPGGMGGPGPAMPGGPGGVKGAQAAAQAAMIAAANSSAAARQQGSSRSSGGKTPTSSSGPGSGPGTGPGPGPGPGPTPPRMYTPPPGGHGGPMNHVNFGNPSLNSLSNSVNQLGNSMTPCSVPNAMGPSSGLPAHPNSATNMPPSSMSGGPNGPPGGAPQMPAGPGDQGPSGLGAQGPGGKGPESSGNNAQQSSSGPDAKDSKGADVSVNGAATGKPGESLPPSTMAGEGRTSGSGSGGAPAEGGPPSSQPSDVPASAQSALPPASCSPESMQQPITTTANTSTSDGLTTSVTQSITQPVASVPASSSNSMPLQQQQQQQPPQGCVPPGIPPVPNCAPMPSFPEEPPEKKKKECVYPPTPATVASSSFPGSALAAYLEDSDNTRSPSWPGTPKSGSSDLSKLYEMGQEPDRKSFLDRVLAYLEEKGQPITTMPAISKQPLDLYRLYREVQNRGGMVEVNKAKKWKEICGVVNIGSSASAAFTLKKNYIKYLFNFECKYERDDQDPVPILAQMEAQLQQKREQKNKRAPSPGSQGSSQDAFRPPSTPNSQMMDPFSPGMQPHYMQNSDGNMVPPGMPGNMMPPNNMMGGMNPNMMPPGSMGSNMPHPQMMSNNPNMQGGMMGHGQGMMGGSGPPNSMMGGSMGPGQMMGSMGPGQSMMGGMGPNNGMMSGGSFNGPQNGSMMGGSMPHPAGMMGGSGGSMGPPVSSGASTVSTTGAGPSASDSISVQDPFADEPNSSAGPHYSWSNSGMPYQQQPGPHGSGYGYSGRPGPGPGSGGFQGMSQNTPLNNMEGMALRGPSGEGFGDSYRRGMPPNADGFSPSSSRSVDNFPSGPGGSQQFPNRPPHSSSGQFPFAQYDRQERFDPSSGAHPGQQFRPSQSGMMPPGAEGGYTPRTFSGQQMPGMRPPHPPQEGGYSSTPSSQSYPGQSGGYGGPRPPVGQDQCGIFSGPSTGFPGPRPSRGDMPGSMYGTPSKRFPDMDRGPSDPRREASQWGSPMSQRFPSASPNFINPAMSGMPAAPGTPPMGPFGRNMGHRASPQSRDKMMMSKQQKPCTMLPNSQYPKKDIVFPPDTVEAVEPHHSKRRRLNNKDIGPLEAWRLMMGLKSGLLAESTWAIDALNILLYDDSTVGYFNLVHLPGLLEVLLEHFRRCLIQMFGIFRELEIGFEKEFEEAQPNGVERESDEEADDDEEADGEVVARLKGEEDLPDFTLVSRSGKTVKVEEKSTNSWVHDNKKWDVFCGFNGGAHHWQIGCGDITSHIITQFTSTSTHKLLKRLFFNNRTSEKENESEQGKKCGKVKGSEGGEEVVVGDVEEEEEEPAAVENGHGEEKMETDEEESQKKDLSEACHKSKVRNNFMKDVQIKTEPRDPELDGCDSNEATIAPDSTPAESKKTEVNPSSPKSTVKTETQSPEAETQKAPSKPSSPKSSSPSSSSNPPTSTTECPTSPKSIKQESEETPMEEDNNDSCTPSGDSEGPPVLSQELPLEVKRVEEEKCQMRQMLASCQLFIKEEEEAMVQDETPLSTTSDGQEELGLRCVCLSNIFRSLSCIPGNEVEMSNHPGLIRVLGQLLLLHHTHPPRAPKSRRGFAEQEGDELTDTTEECGPPRVDWWWDYLLALRENALVIFANISGHLDLSKYPEEVCFPVLDGLLHWAVCPSSCARDPMPFQTGGSSLSPQRLVLEALCKLCIHDANVDLLLATPPFARIVDLFGNLSRLLANKKEQVTQEFAIVLMSELVTGDSCAARAVALHHPTISLLVDFLESAEQEAMRVVSSQGMHVLQSNPEGMLGTSLDMLRRAANILLHLARVPENRPLFSRHQPRLLALVMSQILDSSVAQIVSDVLYECSQPAS